VGGGRKTPAMRPVLFPVSRGAEDLRAGERTAAQFQRNITLSIGTSRCVRSFCCPRRVPSANVTRP